MTAFQDYLGGLAIKMRAAAHKADELDHEWNQINDAFKVKHAREDVRRKERGEMPKTALMKAQEKNDNILLNEAFSAHAWWRTQAQYYANLIVAEKAVHDALHSEG